MRVKGIGQDYAKLLQIAGVDISTDVINMIPFVAVILSLILFARGDFLPPALAQPYVRGAR